MAVDDGLYVRPCLVDFPMNEALKEDALAFGVDRVGIETVLQDIGSSHKFWSDIASHQIAIGIIGMADRNMPEAIEHSLVHQDAVGSHQIFEHDALHRAGG